jgi:hypothetical protein
LVPVLTFWLVVTVMIMEGVDASYCIVDDNDADDAGPNALVVTAEVPFV